MHLYPVVGQTLQGGRAKPGEGTLDHLKSRLDWLNWPWWIYIYINIQSWQSIGPIGANQVADSAHKFTSRRLSLGPLGPIGGWWLLELLDVNMWVVHFVVSGAGRYTSKGYSKAEMAWNRNGTKKCGSHESHDTDTIRIRCQKFWSSSRSSRSQQGHV